MPTPPQRDSDNRNGILRFSSMVFTMAGSIGFFVWLGRRWDDHSNHQIPIGTLIGGVLGTAFAIWLVIRELSK